MVKRFLFVLLIITLLIPGFAGVAENEVQPSHAEDDIELLRMTTCPRCQLPPMQKYCNLVIDRMQLTQDPVRTRHTTV